MIIFKIYNQSLVKNLCLGASVLCTLQISSLALAKNTNTTSQSSSSSSLFKDLDSLGSNKAIVERAQAIDAENKVRVVQNRTVDRHWRIELGMSYDGVTGGDSYLKTNNLGYAFDLHVNPKFSLGARYWDSYNQLTPEGKRVFNEASQKRSVGDNSLRPDIDSPLSTTMGIMTIYPLYGKLNFFNLGITQFDLYMTGGYGTMKLTSGSSPTWMGGGGVGIWWSQHFSSRFEVRYQEYQDSIYSGKRNESITAFSFGIGLLL